jgi:hypothetical protein
MPRYHTATFALAGLEARPSPANLNDITGLERRLGQLLPESFRDVVTSDAYPELLATFSNCDVPLSARDLGTSVWRDKDEPPPGVLQFMLENQGVCRWGIELQAADPKVLVQVDGKVRPSWRLCAESFSEWLRCQVLDHQLMERAVYAAQAAPLTDVTLARLRSRFAREPLTFGWPGDRTHRFTHELGQVLLWDSDGQCDWWIAPSEIDHARALLDLLPFDADVANSLYELVPEGAPLLQEWRTKSKSS